MLKPKLLLSLALMMALSIGGSVFAQEQISGPQSGILGPGTYLVVGDIQVPAGEILEIVPGTEFLHNGNHTWEIYGRFNAEGAEGDSIFFIRQNPVQEHRWGGIRFLAQASDASTVNYCVIDNVYIPPNLPSTYNGGGISIDSVDVTISNTRISNCSAQGSGGGIYAKAAAVTIDHCLIIGNEEYNHNCGGGIALYNCGGVLITHSIIAFNSSNGT